MWRASGVAFLGAMLLAAVPAEAQDEPAARAVLHRLIGSRADAFTFVRRPGTGADWYAVTAKNGRVRIEGRSPVALVRGAYTYLGDIGAASVSWDGDRVVLPARLPDLMTGRVSTPFGHRLYLNTCTYGYTTPWWN
ncbi:MAG TPA: alpha-N-acetylglucosaminidase N-terminal domain-containing protein, partial [Sphingomonas sp.]|uniref:alpha-N-acetylglucosaminidase N-terminal domain-containing protein n=1 Tax=Sphingomonas sp. TaxID=28214 RepID=UPI002EDB4E52